MRNGGLFQNISQVFTGLDLSLKAKTRCFGRTMDNLPKLGLTRLHQVIRAACFLKGQKLRAGLKGWVKVAAHGDQNPGMSAIGQVIKYSCYPRLFFLG